MEKDLLRAIKRHADSNANATGHAPTVISGMTTIRAMQAGRMTKGILKPLVCLVLQGSKEVTSAHGIHRFVAGESLIVSADLPISSRIIEASEDRPYYSLAIDLDLALISELAGEMEAQAITDHPPIGVARTDREVTETALRIMRLLDHPGSLPILQTSLMRELHYWLLAGRHGKTILHLASPNAPSHKIARAISHIRQTYDTSLQITDLLDLAGMSESSFYQHFKAVTSLTPLQFQKQLRLIEARRQMLAEGLTASSAAFAVGYESVPHFTRDYRRLFGMSPAADRKATLSAPNALEQA